MILQSARIKPYDTCVSGFSRTCRAETRRIVLSEYTESDLDGMVRSLDPRLVLAVGIDALSRAKEVGQVPTVYVMVLGANSLASNSGNITGVSMYISQERQLAIVRNLIPSARSIGVVYDPVRSGVFVAGARESAGAMGLGLIEKEVATSRQVLRKIMELRGSIDLLWMLPDLTAITPETIEAMLLYSMENRVPIMTFSQKYLELGALLSVSIDPYDMGRQAGDMANRILSGEHVRNIPLEYARKPIVRVNRKAARKLGIFLDERMLGESE
ncbi:ABC transporter substrate-binding protein [Thermodesulfobacteriota bacterium]